MGAAGVKERILNCNSTTTQFMLTHSFAVTFGSLNTKPFVSAQQVTFDGQVPVGISYTFDDAKSGANYNSQIFVVCCPRV